MKARRTILKFAESHGFSLVEVTIALGLMTLIASLFIGYTSMSNSMGANARAQEGKQALESEIRRTLSNADLCTGAMPAGITLTLPTATSSGVTNFGMTLSNGVISDFLQSGADLSAHYNVKIAPNGFQVVIPQGAVPEIVGTEKTWTGVLQLTPQKMQKGMSGGDTLMTSTVGTIRLKTNIANSVIGCEGNDSYACPDGYIQTGPYPTDCKKPEQILSQVCKAGEVPVSTGTTINCKDPKELFADLCPSGTVAVSTGGGPMDCRSLNTLTVICGICEMPIPTASGVACEAVPDCGTLPGPSVPVCDFGSCATSGEIKQDPLTNKTLECDGTCWNPRPTRLSCLPPARVKKGDDEWMNFYQDNSMRRPLGSPCEEVMKSASKHARLVNGGTRIKYDDTSKACATDKNCVEVP